MKLELGKSYRTRGGWKATVIATDLRGEYPFAAKHTQQDRDEVEEHNADGEWIHGHGSEVDIIAPWTEKPLITAPWPRWAKACATDFHRFWRWYDMEPHANEYGYSGGVAISFHPSEVPVFSGDWKDSLVLRPEKTAEERLVEAAKEIVRVTYGVPIKGGPLPEAFDNLAAARKVFAEIQAEIQGQQ